MRCVCVCVERVHAALVCQTELTLQCEGSLKTAIHADILQVTERNKQTSVRLGAQSHLPSSAQGEELDPANPLTSGMRQMGRGVCDHVCVEHVYV